MRVKFIAIVLCALLLLCSVGFNLLYFDCPHVGFSVNSRHLSFEVVIFFPIANLNVKEKLKCHLVGYICRYNL